MPCHAIRGSPQACRATARTLPAHVAPRAPVTPQTQHHQLHAGQHADGAGALLSLAGPVQASRPVHQQASLMQAAPCRRDHVSLLAQLPEGADHLSACQSP
jgi:hypothetical protein